MADKSRNKRYTLRTAEALLARLVSFAEGQSAAPQTSRLFRDLLDAGPHIVLGEAAVGVSAINAPALQSMLRTFFRGVITSRDADAGTIVPELSIGQLKIGIEPIKSDVLLTLDGSAVDVLLFQVVNLLQVAGVGRLRRCECGRVFARRGRGEYCSARCQKRVYMRIKRQDERDEARRRTHGKTTRTR